MRYDSIHVSLQTLRHHPLPNQRRLKRPPYLWTAFFKIDGSTVRLSEQFQLQGHANFHFGAGSHGNIGDLNTDSMLAIPPAVGEWQTKLSPIEVPFFSYQMPALLGVAAVLMQENNVSDIGAEAGHESLNGYLEQAVRSAIEGFDIKQLDVERIQPSLKQYFSQQVDRLADGIEDQVRDAIVEAQSWWQNLWSLLDQDELIGYGVWDLFVTEVPDSSMSFPLTQQWSHPELGTWELAGEIRRM